MSKSFTEFDRPYRRGLVLGLSLAELFLILLFLLLLAAIGMAQNERENNKKLVEENKAQNDLLRQLQNEDGSPISAEDLGELVEGIKSKNKIEEENKILKDNLVSLDEKIKQLEKKIKNEEDKTKDYEKIKND